MTSVVVTGMGCISAIGRNTAQMAAALRAGQCGIGPLTVTPTDRLMVKIGAEVAGFDPLEHFDEKRLLLLDRFSQFALVAAREAVAASGLDFRGPVGERAAAILGSGVGGMTTLDESFQRLYLENAKRFQPFIIPKLMISAAISHITMEHGMRGPAFTTASACASANHAIGTAFHMVRAGMVDVALTGGAESVFTPGTLKAWEAMRILAPDTCRPFAKGRKGLVLGEGAAILILESRAHAQARGAPILGEIVGFGMSADAGDIVLPSLDGAVRAMRACIKDSGLAPETFEYVNAHGTGTAMNDVTETRAIHEVFGDHARRLAVSSTKSMHGHALGAAGAIEAVATLLAMRDGFIPPTVNYNEADPQCDLDYVPNIAREQAFDVALSSSFAFGGLNAVLALRR
ncbi:MAG: beta-ACP synthase [Alphaproteobacteria bacterium 64-11]|nr:beta-ketoacyl-[acyl-carrier-protein] synthase family protein [Alphaproteobacteria bacterium]OJU12941.1 MAG: beta-ACP synthase [Alphaproteobacteria bacterium 64-11]